MTRREREKEKLKRQVPPPPHNEEAIKWKKYCDDAGIIISPVATEDNESGLWQIGISTPDNYKKIYRSPEKCDKHSLWEVFNRYTKYYYDKRQT